MLICKLLIATVIDSYGCVDAEVRQREGLARALLIEYAAAISAMVFAVGEGKCGSTAHADIGVYPFRRLLKVGC